MAPGTFARRVAGAAVVGLALAGLPSVVAQPLPKSPYRTVDPVALSLDGTKAYTLHFAYITPRIARVKTPDKGERTVWYMPFYVLNKTGAPRDFMPKFELVTKDPDGLVMNSLDESQPFVVDTLRKLEDPQNVRDYKTTVSIGRTKIEDVSKKEAYADALATYGIAVWLDVPEKANPNHFSVYVTGLSDGLAKKEIDDKGQTKVVISEKTLQLDFKRPSASRTDRADDIKVNENNGLGAETWKYRESQIIPKAVVPK